MQDRRPRGEFPRERGRFRALDVTVQRALARGVGEALGEVSAHLEPPGVLAPIRVRRSDGGSIVRRVVRRRRRVSPDDGTSRVPAVPGTAPGARGVAPGDRIREFIRAGVGFVVRRRIFPLDFRRLSVRQERRGQRGASSVPQRLVERVQPVRHDSNRRRARVVGTRTVAVHRPVGFVGVAGRRRATVAVRAELARRRRHDRHDRVAQPPTRGAVKIVGAEAALRALRPGVRPARQDAGVVPVETVRVYLVPAAHDGDALTVHQGRAGEARIREPVAVRDVVPGVLVSADAGLVRGFYPEPGRGQTVVAHDGLKPSLGVLLAELVHVLDLSRRGIVRGKRIRRSRTVPLRRVVVTQRIHRGQRNVHVPASLERDGDVLRAVVRLGRGSAVSAVGAVQFVQVPEPGVQRSARDGGRVRSLRERDPHQRTVPGGHTVPGGYAVTGIRHRVRMRLGPATEPADAPPVPREPIGVVGFRTGDVRVPVRVALPVVVVRRGEGERRLPRRHLRHRRPLTRQRLGLSLGGRRVRVRRVLSRGVRLGSGVPTLSFGFRPGPETRTPVRPVRCVQPRVRQTREQLSSALRHDDDKVRFVLRPIAARADSEGFQREDERRTLLGGCVVNPGCVVAAQQRRGPRVGKPRATARRLPPAHVA